MDFFTIMMNLIFMLAVGGFMVWFAILLPHRMATKRNRDGIAWVLVSLCGSPFFAIFMLWALGEKDP